MPELPEVETVRLHLEKALKRKAIDEVVVDHDDKYFFKYAKAAAVVKALHGRKVTGSGRRGKYFWLELDRKPWPLIHLGMTGNAAILRPAKAGEAAERRRVWGGANLKSSKSKTDDGRPWFARLMLGLKDGTEVVLTDPRRFARLWLTDDPENHPRVARLGRDPLADFPSAKDLGLVFAKRRVAIKTLLLDQEVFAGIGNWLADEILFHAKLSPHHAANSLSAADIARLRKYVIEIPKKAVAVEADYERFPKSWLFHHRWGKAKDAKLPGGAKIEHDEIGGRTTAWVPSRQR
jgi:formamidopyrimidine-DNA glycosylase